ncbi:MAG: hypothetical protein NW201_06110 [Gemmatimonadales bacterium]|nr:hypothetical protein [Gemmatimonadales bacterium]
MRHAARAALLLLAAARPAAAQVPADTTCPVYFRFELALRDAPVSGAPLRRLSEAFDGAVLAFLGGDRARATIVQDSLATALEGGREDARARHCGELRRRLGLAQGERHQLQVATQGIPYRVAAPLVRSGDPLPLVIALVGAGGNEHTFLEGYGAGVLGSLARQRRFVAVTPRTDRLIGDAGNLDRLIDAVLAKYRIDPKRIYVIGHSLGAAAAWGFVQLPGSRVAAVACIAGPCGGPVPAAYVPALAQVPPRTGAGRPPLWLATAGADRVVADSVLARARDAARAAGWSVQERRYADHGHTTVVGAAVPDAVAWLLAQR